MTLAAARQRYWIMGGRVTIKTHIHRCVTCTRQRGERAQQLMGQLPPARVITSRPFLETGVDYAGSVTVKSWKGRGGKTHKAWMCIFVCMATSAIHIEVVTDYTASAFLAAFHRFTGRRGTPKKMYSECGTNFKGAEKELRRLFNKASDEAKELAPLLLKDGTQWSFNSPSAPHFGGKWEAAVKSVKHHLARAVGDVTLTLEELDTLLIRIERVLNSRPLEPLSEDPDDFNAITPGHFLTGEALNAVPDENLLDSKLNTLDRWQCVTQRFQYFWKRWSRSHINHLQQVNKWRHPSQDIKIGTMVLLYDERFPPAKWPLARVIELHPGKDGLTRVVTLRTASSTFTRPIAKLVILPVVPNAD